MVQATGSLAVEQKRLFISGVAPSLSKEDLTTRLCNYGTIIDDLVLNKKNADTTGIFGHCTISLDAGSWSKLRKLSGTILKGSKLRIEEAKQDWVTRKALDERRPQPAVPNPRKRPPTGTMAAVESKRVKRGEVVRDSNITQKSRKQGWIKGRYGRAIAILKTKTGLKLSRNPDALSRLWGAPHITRDQLVYYYDDEEDEWHDRRGRVIREIEISKKRQPTEDRQGGRVEIWGSDDEEVASQIASGQVDGEYTVASSSRPDYVAAGLHELEGTIDEAELDAQLLKERSTGLSLLGDMFKDTEVAAAAVVDRQEKRRIRDKLDIVKRFDPTAPESESEAEPENTDNASPQNVMEDQRVTGHVHVVQSATNGDVLPRYDNNEPQAEDEEREEEQEPLPSFLQRREDIVNTGDLTSIFKVRTANESAAFTLFPEDEEMDDAEDHISEAVSAPADNLNIHPDRLNRPRAENEQSYEGEENANFTAMTKDRGFSVSNFMAGGGVFPLLLSSGPGSFWDTQVGFFGDVLDVEAIKRRWEETRGEVTRDWKRKRREGTKKMRKAQNRKT